MFTFVYFDKPNDVEEWHDSLKEMAAKDKASRLIVKQFAHCQTMVGVLGTRASENFFKKLEDNLYELRPGDYRIFCCQWQGNKYVMLSHYEKDDNATRSVQLKKARQRRDDWIKRHGK